LYKCGQRASPKLEAEEKEKNAFPLRGRCQRKLTDEVEMNNDCLRVYTSPPPLAEPLLKEKPLESGI
jgi:hypothetical protein